MGDDRSTESRGKNSSSLTLSTLAVMRAHDDRLRRVFYEHDMGTGRLSKEQLRSALNALGALRGDVSNNALKRFIAMALVDNAYHDEYELSLREFRTLFSPHRLKQLFDSLDTNHSGTITSGELIAAFGRILDVDANEARLMISKIDTKRTGEIDFEEFFKAFEFVPAADLKSVARRWHHLTGVDAGSPDFLIEHAPGLTLWQTVAMGGASSIASRTVTAPIERLKIEAQTSATSLDLITEARRIVRNEGVFRGLFRGHLLNCLRAFPNGALGCTTFVNLLDREPRATANDPRLHEIWRMCCAVISTSLVTTLTYPVDSLRTRWTVIGGGGETTAYVSPKTVPELLRDIIREEGIGSLFRGIAPAIYSVGPFVAVQQCALDFAKFYTIDRRRLREGRQSHHPFLLACVGAFSGLIAQTVTYPLEVVRRRMQLGAATSVATGNPVPNDTWLALRQIVREDGLRGLFHGILPTYLMVGPSCATGYLVAVSLFTRFKQSNVDNAANLYGASIT